MNRVKPAAMNRVKLKGRTAGFTLVEVMIALIILTVGMLALGHAAGQSVRRSSLTANDFEVWSDIGRITDSLTFVGWGGVTGATESHTRHSLAWTVSSPLANLDRVQLVVTRQDAMGQTTRQDTLVLLLAQP